MIKINLIKSKVGDSVRLDPGGANLSTNMTANIRYDNSEQDRPQGIIKIVLMLGFVLVAYFYRSHVIGQLELQTQSLSQQESILQEELRLKTEQAGSKVELEEQARELKNRLEVIKNLSKGRIKEVRALDYIQSVVPEQVWLKSISYQQTQMLLRGNSSADGDLAQFFKSLEKSPFFKDMVVLQSKEDRSQSSVVKSFEVTFKVESQN